GPGDPDGPPALVTVINEKFVQAIGYVPDAIIPIATKKIAVVVTRIKWIDPVCALGAGGENPPLTTTDVQIGGTASVNASTSAQGGAPAGAYCSGVTPRTAVGSSGSGNSNGTANLYSPAGYTNTATCRDGASCGMPYPHAMLRNDSD